MTIEKAAVIRMNRSLTEREGDGFGVGHALPFGGGS